MALRVLQVIPSIAPRLGGPSRVVPDMCAALTRRGIDVVLFTTGLDGFGTLNPIRRPRELEQEFVSSLAGASYESRLFRAAWPSRWVYSPSMGRELRRVVNTFDVVHIHYLFLYPSLAASRAARLHDRPYILVPHAILHPYVRSRHRWRKAVYWNAVEKSVVNGANALQFLTPEERAQAMELDITAPAEVIPFGVDPAMATVAQFRGGFRRAHPHLGDKSLIVFLGRVAPEKGLDLLFNAFAQIAGQFPHSHVVVAGPEDRGFGTTVRRWIRDARLESRVTMLGLVSGAARLSLLADTDLWVLPSYADAFPSAAIEAMACGLPVISTDKINLHHELAASGAARIVSCDTSALAEALAALLSDREARDSLGKFGASYVSENLTWDIAASRLEALYRRLAAGG